MNKMTVRELKEYLKGRVQDIREAKAERKVKEDTGLLASRISFLKREYRYMHIAYCMFRGTPYEAIEVKCREGNEPDWAVVNKIMANIIPTEPKQNAEVICADS